MENSNHQIKNYKNLSETLKPFSVKGFMAKIILNFSPSTQPENLPIVLKIPDWQFFPAR